MPRRRELLMAGAALAGLTAQPAALGSETLARSLREGGGVLMFRHALAPGTLDPPGFQLGDCRTQRNLSEAGRQQARQIGAWMAARQLRPARVRSSPWCRCMDTARLAFGERVEAWAALGSPRAGTEAVNAQALVQLRAELAGVVRQQAGFDVWVSHNFVFQAWLGQSAGSGEAVWLGLNPDGSPKWMERLVMAG